MLRKLLDLYRQIIWTRSVKKHKSCLSVHLAAKYTAFHNQCRRAYVPEVCHEEILSLKSQFDNKGFVIGQNESTKDFANSMYKNIMRLENSSMIWDANGSFVQTKKGDAYGVFPEVELILKGFCGQLVSAIYKSYFKVFFVKLYKHERLTLEPEGSQIWHHDTCPGTCVKILLFLDDVGPDNGGTELIPWEQTLQSLGKEWSFNKNIKKLSTETLTKEEIRKRRAEWYSDHIDNYYTRYKEQVSGPPGTFLLFRPEVLHKGGFPKRGHCRYMLMFSLYPSNVPTPYDHYRRYGAPKRSAFPNDPKEIWPLENGLEK